MTRVVTLVVLIVVAVLVSATAASAESVTVGDIEFSSTGDPDPVWDGDPVTWTISVTNNSAEPITDVSWTSARCGSSGSPITIAAGESSPEQTCTSTAGPEGPMTNPTTFTSTDSVGVTTTQSVTAAVLVRPIVRFYTTSYGNPDPVGAGEQITWNLRALDSDDGTATLVDVTIDSSLCGLTVFVGPFSPGDETPLVTCQTTAPSTPGTVENTTTFSATVLATGEVIETTVTSDVQVLAGPTPVIRFYSTSYGSPDPTDAGQPITWVLRALNSTDGNVTLRDVGWTSSQCGTQLFPGLYLPGDGTPDLACTSIAPATGPAVNVTVFSATVVETGEFITSEVRSEVEVISAPIPPDPPDQTDPDPTDPEPPIVSPTDAGASPVSQQLADTGDPSWPLPLAISLVLFGAVLARRWGYRG